MVKSLIKLFSYYDLTVTDVERGSRYGGNIRVHVTKGKNRNVSKNVELLLKEEEDAGLYEIKTYEKFGHAVIDLANKGNYGVVGDSVQVNYHLNKNKELGQNVRILGSRMTSEFYGVVLRKENLELKRRIDTSLTELLKNGKVEKLHKKWGLGEFAVVPLPE